MGERMMWGRKKEPEVSPPGEMPTEREWNKASQNPRFSMISEVLNNGEDHGLWERFEGDKDGWERILWQLRPHVTAERAPGESIPS
jgi:hypothetical protein